MATTVEEIRFYRGWRRVRGMELLGLTGSGQLVVGVCIGIVVTTIAVGGPVPGLIAAAAALPLVAVAYGRWDGEPVTRAVVRRVRW